MTVNVIFAVAILILLALGLTTGGTIASVMTDGASTPPTSPDLSDNVVPLPMSNSDQSLTGSYITQDVSTWPGPTVQYPLANVWNICAAVAMAEGFNLGPGVAPYDLNNPGDLSPGDESGQATSGPAQSHGGSMVIVFTTVEGGFVALYTKFANIVTGRSKVYPSSWTWVDVAQHYAGDWQPWLNNVTSYLGVDKNSTPAQYKA